MQLETPYIQRDIALTREAYNLGEVAVKPFPAEQDLTSVAQADSGTVENIRLWDWRPLLATYAQLQEIRTYYRFLGVDVDRYHLAAYQQVMISARELDPSLLAADARPGSTCISVHPRQRGRHVPGHRKSPRARQSFISKTSPPRPPAAPR